jgi:uncharacterized alpha-E superfamily protein
MDTVLSKQNRLFWLGRYNERVYTSLRYVVRLYDSTIDGAPVNYLELCQRLDIPCAYSGVDDFFRGYMFDPQNPDSIATSANNMLGNGMVLRETISTATLSYLQMAVNALNLARDSASPAVELQWVLDDIMAFRGSYEDYIADEAIASAIKCGILVERVSMFERLGIHREDVGSEVKKLLNNLRKSRLPVDAASQEAIVDMALGNAELPQGALLRSVESLVTV